jgi:hypothetical protein
MKLKSGRLYKYDLSDVAGILWEHQKSGNPITREIIDKAIITLYGANSEIPIESKKFIDAAFENGDYEQIYNEIRKNEKQAKEILLKFEKDNPNTLKGEDINSILEKARSKL